MSSAPRLPRVLAISPPRPGPWLSQLHRLADLGAEGLLLRLTAAPEALEAALAAPRPADLIVLVRLLRPEDADLARAAQVGLHLPAHADPALWRGRHAGLLLSAACHDAEALHRAAQAGVDLALLSPVSAPGSKEGDRRPTLGMAGLGRLVRRAEGLPVLALGGMTPAHLPEVLRQGAHGIAGISAFFDGEQVRQGAPWP